MQIKIYYPAADNERFAPGAFAHLVTTSVPFGIGDREYQAQIIAAEVAPDGTGFTVELDVDIPGGPVALDSVDTGMSFGVAEIPEQWWRS